MDSTDIKLFLAVMQSGNFVTAAQETHLTQSTLSKRIKKLEDELGIVLFNRGKGVKNVELSQAGILFAEYAQRLQGIHREIETLRFNQDLPPLQLGVLDSIQPLTVRLTERLFARWPDMRMRIHVRSSGEMYHELDQCLIDVGFSHLERDYASVRRRLLFSEPFVVLGTRDCLPGEGEVVRPAELDPNREVFTAWWSPGYRAWHEEQWPIRQSQRLSTSSAHLQLSFLGRGPNSWCVMPYSLAASMRASGDFVMCRLQPEPPPRIVFLLARRQPRAIMHDIVQHFMETLYEILENEEPWASSSVTLNHEQR